MTEVQPEQLSSVGLSLNCDTVKRSLCGYVFALNTYPPRTLSGLVDTANAGLAKWEMSFGPHFCFQASRWLKKGIHLQRFNRLMGLLLAGSGWLGLLS